MLSVQIALSNSTHAFAPQDCPKPRRGRWTRPNSSGILQASHLGKDALPRELAFLRQVASTWNARSRSTVGGAWRWSECRRPCLDTKPELGQLWAVARLRKKQAARRVKGQVVHRQKKPGVAPGSVCSAVWQCSQTFRSRSMARSSVSARLAKQKRTSWRLDEAACGSP